MKQLVSRPYWSQLTALIEQDLAGVTENDLEACQGQRNKLIEKLQEIYGISPDVAEGAVKYYEQQLALCYSRQRGRASSISRWDAYQRSHSEWPIHSRILGSV